MPRTDSEPTNFTAAVSLGSETPTSLNKGTGPALVDRAVAVAVANIASALGGYHWCISTQGIERLGYLVAEAGMVACDGIPQLAA